jgi:hypothetical protein
MASVGKALFQSMLVSVRRSSTVSPKRALSEFQLHTNTFMLNVLHLQRLFFPRARAARAHSSPFRSFREAKMESELNPLLVAEELLQGQQKKLDAAEAAKIRQKFAKSQALLVDLIPTMVDFNSQGVRVLRQLWQSINELRGQVAQLGLPSGAAASLSEPEMVQEPVVEPSAGQEEAQQGVAKPQPKPRTASESAQSDAPAKRQRGDAKPKPRGRRPKASGVAATTVIQAPPIPESADAATAAPEPPPLEPAHDGSVAPELAPEPSPKAAQPHLPPVSDSDELFRKLIVLLYEFNQGIDEESNPIIFALRCTAAELDVVAPELEHLPMGDFLLVHLGMLECVSYCWRRFINSPVLSEKVARHIFEAVPAASLAKTLMGQLNFSSVGDKDKKVWLGAISIEDLEAAYAEYGQPPQQDDFVPPDYRVAKRCQFNFKPRSGIVHFTNRPLVQLITQKERLQKYPYMPLPVYKEKEQSVEPDDAQRDASPERAELVQQPKRQPLRDEPCTNCKRDCKRRDLRHGPDGALCRTCASYWGRNKVMRPIPAPVDPNGATLAAPLGT